MPILTEAQLEAALPEIRDSSATRGTLQLIVARPYVGQRALLDEGELDVAVGLLGDSWSRRPARLPLSPTLNGSLR